MGSKAVLRASSAPGDSRLSPCLDTATGSTTSGACTLARREATTSTIGAEASMPVLTACAPMSPRTESSCAATAAGGSSQYPCTPTEFCAVTAQTTVMPWTPSASMVFRSAWMPAPPPESEPAIASTRGGGVLMAPRVGGPGRRSAPGCDPREAVPVPPAMGPAVARPADRVERTRGPVEHAAGRTARRAGAEHHDRGPVVPRARPGRGRAVDDQAIPPGAPPLRPARQDILDVPAVQRERQLPAAEGAARHYHDHDAEVAGPLGEGLVVHADLPLPVRHRPAARARPWQLELHPPLRGGLPARAALRRATRRSAVGPGAVAAHWRREGEGGVRGDERQGGSDYNSRAHREPRRQQHAADQAP